MFSALPCAAGDTILRTDSHIQADEDGIFLIKKSIEESQQISVEPDTNAVYTTGSMNAINIELNCIFPECDLPDAFTMVLSAGVEFGKANESGVISGVKYCGCGKIMRVA